MKYIDPINKSGYEIQLGKSIKPIKKHHYFVVENRALTGDAPKQFIRVYEYGNVRKIKRSKWPAYIAKTGHKWYPIESVTEHLIGRLGSVLGFNVAGSRIAFVGGQIRFLSRYFLSDEQVLVHGVEIYEGYFENDKKFVRDVEEQGQTRNLFTLQITSQAIRQSFPHFSDQIINDLVKMLIFDAIIGQNDRHFINWGVVTHVTGKHNPYFSPIFDSARGLFWNISEEKIVSYLSEDAKLEKVIKDYIQNSRPKIGWDGEKDINHIQLVEKIYKNEFGVSRVFIKSIVNEKNLEAMFGVIDNEFGQLLSSERRYVIKTCLQHRFAEISKIIVS